MGSIVPPTQMGVGSEEMRATGSCTIVIVWMAGCPSQSIFSVVATTSTMTSIEDEPLIIVAEKLGISSDELAEPDVVVIPFKPEISLVIAQENVTLSDVDDAVNAAVVPPEQISCDSKLNWVSGLGFTVILKV